MKRLIAAGILFAAVITAYIASFAYITKTCDETKELILRCEESYNEGTAHEYAQKLSNLWDEKEKALSFFMNHDRIDDIELEISSLSLYSETKDEILFYEHIETLKMLLHQVKEDTRISVHSIF
ncbi:MAG: DUF4363 family protein [Acutalibacteraceae bacterium]|nr:DUF4363 family protein [Acutalibacteraceae bacterium]